MSWELVGGDPAPGSVDSLEIVAAALGHVASLAAQAGQELDRSTGALGVDRWKGTAAEAFRQDISKLPPKLRDVAVSYGEAEDGVRVFRTSLEGASWDGRRARSAAEQAVADRDAASRRADSAQAEVDGLRAQEKQNGQQQKSLQHQVATTVDPGLQAQLLQQLHVLEATATRLRSDRGAAESTRTRHRHDATEAEERLRAAIRDADAVRQRVSEAVTTAIGILQRAERDANLPNKVQRKLEELKDWVVTYGPVIVQQLKLGAQLFSLAAMVFPPGAAVFKACALVCGAAALVLEFTVAGLTPGGLSTDKLLHLGLDALSIAATVAGGAGAANLSKGLEWAGTAGSLGLEAKEHGVKSALVQGGFLVVTAGAEKGAGAVVEKALATANKNPALKSTLEGLSRQVARSHTLIPVDDRRSLQSLLGTGAIPAGGFLPGNKASTDPTVGDHRLGNEALHGAAEHLAAPAVDHVAEKAEDEVRKRLHLGTSAGGPEPEIDINLPSSRGEGGW